MDENKLAPVAYENLRRQLRQEDFRKAMETGHAAPLNNGRFIGLLKQIDSAQADSDRNREDRIATTHKFHPVKIQTGDSNSTGVIASAEEAIDFIRYSWPGNRSHPELKKFVRWMRHGQPSSPRRKKLKYM